MQDKIFIDSNIFIYAILEGSSNNEKRTQTINLLDELAEKSVITSTQVLGEIFNTLSRKYKVDKTELVKKLEILSETVSIKGINQDTVKKCWDIVKTSNYSYYDSLIVATAIQNECSIFYTEDMQDGHVIEGLRIVNPYS